MPGRASYEYARIWCVLDCVERIAQRLQVRRESVAGVAREAESGEIHPRPLYDIQHIRRFEFAQLILV